VKEKGLDINAQDDNPHSLKTAMHWAVIKKSCKVLKEIIALDGRVDINDFQGRSARTLAMEKNDPEINAMMMVEQSDVPEELVSSRRM
jgi:hypothetical protein